MSKLLGLLTVAFAAGFLVAFFIRPNGKPDTLAVVRDAGASVASDAKADVAALRADYDRQIADLKSENEALRLQAGSVVGTARPAKLTTKEGLALYEEQRKTVAELANQRETDKLLAAGFSMGRIEWIRKRSEELEVDYRRAEDLARRQGKLYTDVMASHLYDNDIDLRHEIGDDEYARYRQALGRSAGVQVLKVLSGGIGESAGIKPGDEIIAYNGARVFNIGELMPLQLQSVTSDASMTVDVLRNGQKVRLSAAGGDLRFTPAIPGTTTGYMLKMADGAQPRLIDELRGRAAVR